MKNKNIVRIIYGAVVIIVIAMTIFMLKKRNESESGEWEIYKNDELNIEVKHPENVEIEVEK
ncbi:MAG: hypothetical protein V1770_05635 [bacterium]